MEQELVDRFETINGQDNRCTAEPIYLVQQKKRTYGFDPAYGEDDYSWVHEHEFEYKADEFDHALLDQMHSWWWEGETPKYWEKVFYVDTWEFVQPFFTERGAQAYIEANRHNLSEPRVYVASGYRNPEWIFLREFLRVKVFIETEEEDG
jgi:hypothetical protein